MWTSKTKILKTLLEKSKKIKNSNPTSNDIQNWFNDVRYQVNTHFSTNTVFCQQFNTSSFYTVNCMWRDFDNGLLNAYIDDILQVENLLNIQIRVASRMVRKYTLRNFYYLIQYVIADILIVHKTHSSFSKPIND
jgi:hypothetical protein